jgi:hypothetical protein
MPTITLRSSQNTLRSPYDHTGDQPSIRLRSSTITLYVSPHTPSGSQAPLSALMASLASARREGEGGNDLVILNAQITFTPVIAWLGISRCLATWITRYCGGDRCADVGTRVGTVDHLHAPQPSEIARTSVVTTPVCAFGAALFAGQVLGATKELAKRRGELIKMLPEKTRRMGEVGQAQIAGWNIDLHYLARGPLSKTCCLSATKTEASFLARLGAKISGSVAMAACEKRGGSPENIQMTTKDRPLRATRPCESNDPSVAVICGEERHDTAIW